MGGATDNGVNCTSLTGARKVKSEGAVNQGQSVHPHPHPHPHPHTHTHNTEKLNQAIYFRTSVWMWVEQFRMYEGETSPLFQNISANLVF